MTELENLVALCWASNTCYTTVCELKDIDNKRVYDGEDKKYWSWGKLKIDLEKGTWKQGEKFGKIGRHFSGERMSCCWNDSRYGLIGIYDRTNLAHLNAMIFDSREATEDSHRGGWD
jgi:hypothetical protein